MVLFFKGIFVGHLIGVWSLYLKYLSGGCFNNTFFEQSSNKIRFGNLYLDQFNYNTEYFSTLISTESQKIVYNILFVSLRVL